MFLPVQDEDLPTIGASDEECMRWMLDYFGREPRPSELQQFWASMNYKRMAALKQYCDAAHDLRRGWYDYLVAMKRRQYDIDDATIRLAYDNATRATNLRRAYMRERERAERLAMHQELRQAAEDAAALLCPPIDDDQPSGPRGFVRR